MSKQIIRNVLGLIGAFLVTGTSLAATAIQLPLWEKTKDPQVFESFVANVKKDGGVIEGRELFRVDHLAGLACGILNPGQPVSADCKQQFRTDNGLRQPVVSFAAFKQRAVSGGWKVSVAPLWTNGKIYQQIAKQQPAESVSAGAIEAPAPVAVSVPAGATLEELKAARQAAAAAVSANRTLSGTVASLQGKLTQATAGSAEAKAEIAALRREQSGLQADMVTMQRGVDEAMNGIVGTAAEAKQQSKRAEATASTLVGRFEQNRTLIYVLGGLVAVVLCLMVFGGRTQRKQGKRLTKVEESVAATTASFDGAVEKGIAARKAQQEQLDAHGQRLTQLEADLAKTHRRVNAAAVEAHNATKDVAAVREMAEEALAASARVRVMTTLDADAMATLQDTKELRLDVVTVDGQHRAVVTLLILDNGRVGMQGVYRGAMGGEYVVVDADPTKILRAIRRAGNDGRIEFGRNMLTLAA
ncbi:MAG: hypothetical protein H6780_01050 [Candidatus Nomurabacteria bacterium]|nr:MAG: hypothetical protein H6780_01050 [Candidatus Nomurabacteria bacterium]